MIFSLSISHFGEPMDTVYMDHRPRVCAYAIAWHNCLSLIEYVDFVGSRPFLGGVRKGRCCYQGAGGATQKFLTRNPPSKPSQAASWFLSCTLGTETCQHMLPLTSFLYNMYLQHVATDLNCIVIIIIITCVYIYIVDRIKGSWIIPEAYHLWSVQWTHLPRASTTGNIPLFAAVPWSVFPCWSRCRSSRSKVPKKGLAPGIRQRWTKPWRNSQ